MSFSVKRVCFASATVWWLAAAAPPSRDPLSWPRETRQARPWSYWHWMGSAEAERFGGTAVYTLRFPAPADTASPDWYLDLGKVAESARVRLNGRDLGTPISPPFRVYAGRLGASNTIEVEVTNLAANRARDLDRRHVVWKNFHGINFVGLDYRPFDASNRPVRESGLLGPVTLRPVLDFHPNVRTAEAAPPRQ